MCYRGAEGHAGVYIQLGSNKWWFLQCTAAAVLVVNDSATPNWVSAAGVTYPLVARLFQTLHLGLLQAHQSCFQYMCPIQNYLPVGTCTWTTRQSVTRPCYLIESRQFEVVLTFLLP